jgi:hypothetical protein
MNQFGPAMDAAIGGYNVAESQELDDEVLSFLTEIITIIVFCRRKSQTSDRNHHNYRLL